MKKSQAFHTSLPSTFTCLRQPQHTGVVALFGYHLRKRSNLRCHWLWVVGVYSSSTFHLRSDQHVQPSNQVDAEEHSMTEWEAFTTNPCSCTTTTAIPRNHGPVHRPLDDLRPRPSLPIHDPRSRTTLEAYHKLRRRLLDTQSRRPSPDGDGAWTLPSRCLSHRPMDHLVRTVTPPKRSQGEIGHYLSICWCSQSCAQAY